MVTDGGISLTAVSSALNFGLRVVQTGYHLKSVPEDTQRLLETIKTVTDDIKYARSLRRQKSAHLNAREKAYIDERISNTEKATDGLEALVEAARVDMMTKFGRVRTRNRALWVVKQCPKVNTAFARLQIAKADLNTAITTMSAREGEKSSGAESWVREDGEMPAASPTYEISQYVLQRNVARKKARESQTPVSYETPSGRLDTTSEPTSDASGTPWMEAEQATAIQSSELGGSEHRQNDVPSTSVTGDILHPLEVGQYRLSVAQEFENTSYRPEDERSCELVAQLSDYPQHLNPYSELYELEGSVATCAPHPPPSNPEFALPYPQFESFATSFLGLSEALRSDAEPGNAQTEVEVTAADHRQSTLTTLNGPRESLQAMELVARRDRHGSSTALDGAPSAAQHRQLHPPSLDWYRASLPE